MSPSLFLSIGKASKPFISLTVLELQKADPTQKEPNPLEPLFKAGRMHTIVITL